MTLSPIGPNGIAIVPCITLWVGKNLLGQDRVMGGFKF